MSPELESYLNGLKRKYRIEDVDFAKLMFLLDEWAEELSERAKEKAVEMIVAR
jgi:hypothetical protein